MAKDYLEEYRKCIKNSYEIQKNGIHTNFLLKPTEARLRNLCTILFREKQKKDDLESFKLYFGFEFSLDKVFELNKKEPMSKFKTIGKFFTLEGSYLQDTNGLDIAAMLVGFENRPFNKFSKMPLGEEDQKPREIISSEQQIEEININLEPKHTKDDEKQTTETPIKDPPQNLNRFKKNISYIITGVVVFILISFGMNYFLKGKDGMAWKENHYEKIDTNEIKDNGSLFLLDEKLLNTFKKITPCDTTKYKKNGIVCLWYGKSSRGKIEFFTALDRHPETGKTLKEVTDYIMNKYGKGPCK